MFKEVMFLSQFVAEKVIPQSNWAIISITEPGRIANLHCDWRDILRLQFHDIDAVTPGLTLFSEDQAKEILTFLDRTKEKCTFLIVHCNAGISRSAAVAKFVSETFKIPMTPRSVLYSRFVYRILSSLSKSGSSETERQKKGERYDS